MTQIAKITFPSSPFSLSTLLPGNKIAFIKIQYDTCPENPLVDWDCFGNIHSFNTNHPNFIDLSEEDPDKDAVPLSYSRHGDCTWSVHGSTASFCRFDGVAFAGIWVPNETLREGADELGLEGDARKEYMAGAAKDACEVYTAWCNGEAYECQISVHKAKYTDKNELFDKKSDYRFDREPVYQTEVPKGGYFAFEDALAHVKEELQSNLQLN